MKKLAVPNAECGLRLPADRQGLRNVKPKTAWSMEIGAWRQEG
jgi:hypothetical protein